MTAWGRTMKSNHWKSMSIDELWTVHEEVAAILSDKIAAKKAALKEQLRKVELRPGLFSAQLRSEKSRTTAD
jgi:hypothetical protein